MKTLALPLILLALALPALAGAASRDGFSLLHSERLRQLEVSSDAAPASGGKSIFAPTTLRFDALGRRFDVQLEPNASLLGDRWRRAVNDGVGVYRGRLSGVDRSWVRIVMADGVPSGLIFDGSERYAIERPGDSAAESDAAVIYRLADLRLEPGALSCASGGGQPMTAAGAYDAMVGELKVALAEGAVEEIEIGVVGDALFSDRFANPEAAILDRLNRVDGIYSRELGIQISVPVVDAFDTNSDPFSDTTESRPLLEELRNFRRDDPTQNQLGLTHMYTGRALEGSTVGVAYIGVLCQPGFGVGLTEGRRGAMTDSLIAAHEIGHNFGADHDGDADGACPGVPENEFLMGPSVNGSETFSECSKSVMLAEAAAASCIAPLPSIDVAVTSFDAALSVLLGNTVEVSFDIDNRGSIDADDVLVEIDLPDTVSLLAADASTGTCTSGAATASCEIGRVAGNSAAVVTLSVAADIIGPATFVARVSAETDDNSRNNEDIHVVTIEPAVNLGVETSPAGRVPFNGTGSVDVGINNTSTLAATGVSVTVTFDAGLVPESANWTAGSCRVGETTVDCDSDSLGAQTATTLTLGVSGATAGTQGFTVSLGSNEIDADPADNVVSGSVNVVSETQAGRNGGGGGTGFLLIAFLAVFAARGRTAR